MGADDSLLSECGKCNTLRQLCLQCVTVAAHALRRLRRRANGTNGAAVCLCFSLCPRFPSWNQPLLFYNLPGAGASPVCCTSSARLERVLQSRTARRSPNELSRGDGWISRCRLLFALPCSVLFWF